MKVLAIGTVSSPLTDEQKQRIMPREVPDTLKLYLDGVIEQMWFRQDPDKVGVVFLLNVESLDQARKTIEALPLTAGKFIDYDFIQIGPLAPLGMLLPAK